MEKIRNAGKKHRNVMLIVVACLCLSLVIGFATMGSMNRTTASIEDQIAYYEDYIVDLEKKDDTATKGQLAAVYAELGSLYYQSGNNEKYTELSTKANETYVAYYEAMVAEQRNASGDNRALLASYLESLGSYYSNLGQTEKATTARSESYGLQVELYKEYTDTAKKDATDNASDDAKQYTVGYYLYQLATVYGKQEKKDESKAAYIEAAEYFAKAAGIVDAALGSNPEHKQLHSVADYKLEEYNAYNLAGETDKAKAASIAAAGYYEKAVATASGAAEKASDLINWGYSLTEGGDAKLGAEKYEEAIVLAPDNIGVVQAYINYTISKDGGLSGANIKIAKEKLAEIAKYYTKAGDAKDAYDNLVYTIDFYDQIFGSIETETKSE